MLDRRSALGALALPLLAVGAASAQPRGRGPGRPGSASPGAAPETGRSGAPPESTASTPAKDANEFAPFPPAATVRQTTTVGGRTVAYTATVGSLPVRDEKGHRIADVVYTAYLAEGSGRDRPVTFAFNGGPGAASCYLNLGAIGPKRVQFGANGDSPSDPAALHDNAGSWIDFTDLVFIDPVGTGFSRSLVDQDQTKAKFYAVQPDIEYLSRIVYDWLLKNGRLQSPKYVVGESYGGFRGPRLTHYLQTKLGVGVTGTVLVSPLLDSASRSAGDISPLPWMMTLPSVTASYLERQNRLTPEAMQGVIAYTRGDYLRDIVAGRSDPGATDRVVKRVAEMTGLAPEFVRRCGGRLETQAVLREVFRATGKLGSRYDINVQSYDPFPYDPDQRPNDPILDSIIAPCTTAMVDFVTRIVGWKIDARYEPLSDTVNRLWDRGRGPQTESVTDLRESLAIDPKLKVLIVHGWNDLSCPFMASVLIADQTPVMGSPDRLQVREYPGGHMFYSRPDSQQAFRRDVRALYGA